MKEKDLEMYVEELKLDAKALKHAKGRPYWKVMHKISVLEAMLGYGYYDIAQSDDDAGGYQLEVIQEILAMELNSDQVGFIKSLCTAYNINDR